MTPAVLRERAAQAGFAAAAGSTVAVALICVFLFANGVPGHGPDRCA